MHTSLWDDLPARIDYSRDTMMLAAYLYLRENSKMQPDEYHLYDCIPNLYPEDMPAVVTNAHENLKVALKKRHEEEEKAAQENLKVALKKRQKKEEKASQKKKVATKKEPEKKEHVKKQEEEGEAQVKKKRKRCV